MVAGVLGCHDDCTIGRLHDGGGNLYCCEAGSFLEAEGAEALAPELAKLTQLRELNLGGEHRMIPCTTALALVWLLTMSRLLHHIC